MKGLVQLDREQWADYFDLELIVHQAEQSLHVPTLQITDHRAPYSEGGPHDYYSNGDYWWPNPDTQDGLPYVRRDGESNPGNFSQHRVTLRAMRTHVARLAGAYRVTGDERFASKAVQLLRSFFLDEGTRMNPHLLYAQAIPGVCPGRGIGIIDTLHLIDIPFAVQALRGSSSLTAEVEAGLVDWFSRYLHWMSTHEYGIQEQNEPNNHGICWFEQAAAFARFSGDETMLAFCRENFKTKLLPRQMATDGSLPRELKRTKPYAYSIFALDNLVTLCHLLSRPDDDLWEFALADGRGIKRGLDYLTPYLMDKMSWPYQPDVEEHEHWPVAMSFMLFAGLAYESSGLLRLWQTLERDPASQEVRRNMAIRQPLLWL
jgi:hypothetical protein